MSLHMKSAVRAPLPVCKGKPGGPLDANVGILRCNNRIRSPRRCGPPSGSSRILPAWFYRICYSLTGTRLFRTKHRRRPSSRRADTSRSLSSQTRSTHRYEPNSPKCPQSQDPPDEQVDDRAKTGGESNPHDISQQNSIFAPAARNDP